MLSIKTILLLLLSLVLSTIFTFSSSELRLAIGVPSSWALGHILQRRLGLPAGFRQVLHLYTVLSFGLLAATNDLAYDTTTEVLLALSLPRLLRSAARSALGLLSLAILLALWSRLARDQSKSLANTLDYLGEHGELPPWFVAEQEERARRAKPAPVPKRDTRYCHLSDEVIFVCGRGGGFERVVDLDFESAISRRRGIGSKSPDEGWSRRAEIRQPRKRFAFT